MDQSLTLIGPGFIQSGWGSKKTFLGFGFV